MFMLTVKPSPPPTAVAVFRAAARTGGNTSSVSASASEVGGLEKLPSRQIALNVLTTCPMATDPSVLVAAKYVRSRCLADPHRDNVETSRHKQRVLPWLLCSFGFFEIPSKAGSVFRPDP